MRPQRRNRRKPVRRNNAIKSAIKTQRGFVPRRVRHDPPPYKENPQFQYRRRITGTGDALLSTSDLHVGQPLSVKVVSATLHGPVNGTKGVKLRVSREEYFGATYTQVETWESSDEPGTNHRAACSVRPGQDDWLNVTTASGESPKFVVSIACTDSDEWVLDIVLLGKYAVPILEVVRRGNNAIIREKAKTKASIAIPESQFAELTFDEDEPWSSNEDDVQSLSPQ